MAGERIVTEVTIEGRRVKLEVEDTPSLPAWENTVHVGRPIMRVDARAKVTGRARYAVDVHLPGLLEGAILRSPHAHARVTHLDDPLEHGLLWPAPSYSGRYKTCASQSAAVLAPAMRRISSMARPIARS